MADTTIRFNFNFKSSAGQSGRLGSRTTGSKEEVNKASYTAINYIVEDIAFKAAKSQQRAIQNQLEARIAGIVSTELRKMGRLITTTGIGIGGQYRSPKLGSLSLEGGVSRTFAKIQPDAASPMTISSVTGDWRDRTKEYLRRKLKKYGHRKWWLNKGELKAALANPQTYLGAYGPVRVKWIPTSTGRGFGIRPGQTNALFRSNLARGIGRTYAITTGRIEMSILGRITPQMLNEPGQPAYNSKFTGLFDSMREDVEKKLLGRYNPRPLVEPFLTYYVNRQIPNKIWRTLEASMKAI